MVSPNHKVGATSRESDELPMVVQLLWRIVLHLIRVHITNYGSCSMDWRKLNEGYIPFRVFKRIWFEVLVQVAFLGEPLVASKRSGSNRTKHFAIHLLPNTVALTATRVSVVVKMATGVADPSTLLPPNPTAHPSGRTGAIHRKFQSPRYSKNGVRCSSISFTGSHPFWSACWMS